LLTIGLFLCAFEKRKHANAFFSLNSATRLVPHHTKRPHHSS
jgi:hypothetical protein